MPEVGPDIVCLDKRHRVDVIRILPELRRVLRSTDAVVCFNWYANVLVSAIHPSCSRIVRYGAPVTADIPEGVRTLFAVRAHRTADAAVGLTWEMTRDACERMGSPRTACAAIRNAVESHRVDAGMNASPYFAVAARLVSEKGVDRVIRAFARVVSCCPHSLRIAGAGPERQRLGALASSLGVEERVEFVGFLPEPWSFLAGSTALLNGSLWEGYGSSMIEALALGTPVIAMDVPWGPAEILSRVPAGILVPDGDIERFGEAMLGLGNSEPRRRELSVLALRLAPGAFGAETMASSYWRLLCDIRQGDT
jgi:glycosyltransferase involved in cell wall biosynthesis